MSRKQPQWTPTPTFLYRNYLYKTISNGFPRKYFFLDIGCGNGVFLNHLIGLGFKGEAIDISRQALDFAKKQIKNPQAIKIKLQNLFKYKPTKKYDLVFCFEVLEHIENDQEAIDKIFTFLAPGGSFVCSIPAHQSEWSKIDELKGHFRRYERNELSRKLTSAGFKVQNIYSYGFPVLWILRRISSNGRLLNSKSKNLDQDQKTKESSIEEEYNPKLQFIVNSKLIMYPLFWIMNIFIKTDLGLGYIVVCKKPVK